MTTTGTILVEAVFHANFGIIIIIPIITTNVTGIAIIISIKNIADLIG